MQPRRTAVAWLVTRVLLYFSIALAYIFIIHFSLPLMTLRLSSFIGWTCAILVSALTIMSAIVGFIPPTDPAMIEMGIAMGVAEIGVELGITKLIIAALFLYPRTSTVGFVLMVGYYGGALATNITHGFSVAEYTPILVVFALLTVSASIRNPELLARVRAHS